MSPFLRSANNKKKARKCKQEANRKLKNLSSSKSFIKKIAKSLCKNRNNTNSQIKRKSNMGQKLSIFVRRSPSNIKTRSLDESEQRAVNIDEAPHPNETLALRIKRYGPTNVVLVIRTNSTHDGVSYHGTPNNSPSHFTPSSSVYLRIHAHREVLCKRSKYFYSMLQGPNKSRFRTKNCPETISDDELELCDSSEDEIDLISIYRKSPSEMADMVGQVLHFLYFDERALNPDNVQTLLEAANYFQVEYSLDL